MLPATPRGRLTEKGRTAFFCFCETVVARPSIYTKRFLDPLGLVQCICTACFFLAILRSRLCALVSLTGKVAVATAFQGWIYLQHWRKEYQRILQHFAYGERTPVQSFLHLPKRPSFHAS